MAHVAVRGDSQPAEVWPPWSKGFWECILCLAVLALGGEGHPVYWEDTGNSPCLYPPHIISYPQMCGDSF